LGDRRAAFETPVAIQIESLIGPVLDPAMKSIGELAANLVARIAAKNGYEGAMKTAQTISAGTTAISAIAMGHAHKGAPARIGGSPGGAQSGGMRGV
jgi:hypothetical protein